MQDRPTTPELLDAVRLFLEAEILPALDNDGLRFRCRVAANVLKIAGRDLSGARAQQETVWRMLNGLWAQSMAASPEPGQLEHALAVRLHALCAEIRNGAEPEATPAVLDELLRGQLRASNPAWLKGFTPV